MADEIQDIGQDIIDTVTDPQVIVTATIIFVSQGYLGHTGAGFRDLQLLHVRPRRDCR